VNATDFDFLFQKYKKNQRLNEHTGHTSRKLCTTGGCGKKREKDARNKNQEARFIAPLCGTLASIAVKDYGIFLI